MNEHIPGQYHVETWPPREGDAHRRPRLVIIADGGYLCELEDALDQASHRQQVATADLLASAPTLKRQVERLRGALRTALDSGVHRPSCQTVTGVGMRKGVRRCNCCLEDRLAQCERVLAENGAGEGGPGVRIDDQCAALGRHYGCSCEGAVAPEPTAARKAAEGVEAEQVSKSVLRRVAAEARGEAERERDEAFDVLRRIARIVKRAMMGQESDGLELIDDEVRALLARRGKP